MQLLRPPAFASLEARSAVEFKARHDCSYDHVGPASPRAELATAVENRQITEYIIYVLIRGLRLTSRRTRPATQRNSIPLHPSAQLLQQTQAPGRAIMPEDGGARPKVVLLHFLESAAERGLGIRPKPSIQSGGPSGDLEITDTR